MNSKVKRVKLYVKDTPKAHKIEKKVEKELLDNGFEIVDDSFDLAISIGGDGTFLKMVHETNFNFNIHYASINAGSLGFLSSIHEEQIEVFIQNLKSNLYMIQELNVLKSKVFYQNHSEEYCCINELVIRKKDFSSLRCNIFIDEVVFNKFVGDGLVISTAIGSTAYNMVLGGSIIDSTINALSLTPIAPINNKVYRSFTNSLVFNSNRKVIVILNDKKNVSILCDGKIDNLGNVKKIECQLNDKCIKCIMPSDYNHIKNIKSKVIDFLK